MSIVWLVVVGILNHSALTAIRIASSLQAIALGATPLEVGIVVGLFAVLPALLSVRMGRVADRWAEERLMLEGSVGLAVGTALPAIWQALPVLYASSAIVGLSFLRFQLALQTATGNLGGAADVPRNFSRLSLAMSTSAFLGPLLAGVSIDLGGYRVAFLLVALLPLLAIAALLRVPSARTAVRKTFPARARKNLVELLREPRLRFVLACSALFSMAWDLHAFFVPIYGTRIGLSASQSGMILSSFAAATFLVRLAMTRLMGRIEERRVLTVALALASAVFFVYPLVAQFGLLLTLSFVLGLGLGSSQPVVLSLIHTTAPRERVGEVTGLRQSIVNTTQFAVPLIFGAVGTATGFAPLFWAVAGCLATGSWFARPGRS
jgi:MFS family permease